MSPGPKKLLIISYYWPPSGGAGVQRILKFVKYFREFGYQPFVLTVDAEKASYPVRDPSLLDDVPADVPVFRTDSFEPLSLLTRFTGNKAPYGGFANKDKEKFSQKVLRFIRGNFFIPDARKGWVRYAYRKAEELVQREKIESVIISSPPHSSQLIGLKLKKKFPGLKWIADLRDPWTDIYYYPDMLHTRAARAKDLSLEKQVVEQADELVVVSAPIVRSYLSKSDRITEKKIHIIPNGFDETDFKETVSPANDPFTITYVGTMADIYNPAVFFQSLKQALSGIPGKNVRLRFVGGRTSNIVSLVHVNQLEAVTEFIPHVPHQEAIRYMLASSALLLVIPDVPDSHGILTGKLFEYLASRRPIVCIGATDGDAARIIRECNAGKTFDRSQGGELTTHLQQLISSGNTTAGNESVRNYSRENLTRQLEALL